jgi:hypothetical protein
MLLQAGVCTPSIPQIAAEVTTPALPVRYPLATLSTVSDHTPGFRHGQLPFGPTRTEHEENLLMRSDELSIESLTTGPNAHGYGRLADGRDFAFRVRNGKAWLEIYRSGADAVVPAPSDVELVSVYRAGEVNLDQRRNLIGLVHRLVECARPVQVRPERTVRGFLSQLSRILGDSAA